MHLAGISIFASQLANNHYNNPPDGDQLFADGSPPDFRSLSLDRTPLMARTSPAWARWCKSQGDAPALRASTNLPGPPARADPPLPLSGIRLPSMGCRSCSRTFRRSFGRGPNSRERFPARGPLPSGVESQRGLRKNWLDDDTASNPGHLFGVGRQPHLEESTGTR